eukprot:172324_1
MTLPLEIDQLTFDTMEITASTLALLYLVFAFYYQSIYIWQLKTQKTFKYYSSKFTTLLIMPFGVVFVLTELIVYMSKTHASFTLTQCWIAYVFTSGSMALAKLFEYFTLCLMVIEAYSDANIYSYKFLLFWQCYLVIGTIVSSVLSFTAFEFDLTNGTCDKTYPMWVMGIWGTHQSIIFTVNVILFAKPLCHMVKVMEAMKQTITTGNQIKYLIRKTSILGILCVLSSNFFVSMISVVATTEFWMSLELIITTTCVLLVFHRNEKIFDCLCGCLMGKIGNSQMSKKKQCLLGFNTIITLSGCRSNDEQQLENAIQNQQSSTTNSTVDVSGQKADPKESNEHKNGSQV